MTREMPSDTAATYLKTRVLTARPAELRMMLLDGAVKFANQARLGLEERRHEQAYNGFTQSRAIVLELVDSINEEIDPELAQRVRSLYMFMYAELAQASFEKNLERLGKVIELLEYERQTWMLVLKKLAEEAAPSAPASITEPRPNTPAYSPISVQG